MKRDTSNDSMYSGTPCDKCGGPTLRLPSGSIWCSAEDPHPGGHFVVRVAFERAPNKAPRAITPRVIKPQTSAPVQNLSEPTSALEGGYDDFVSGSDK